MAVPEPRETNLDCGQVLQEEGQKLSGILEVRSFPEMK